MVRRRHRTWHAVLAGSLLASPVASWGQGAWSPRRCVSDTLAAPGPAMTTVDTVATGITYRCVVDPAGPWVLHVVGVDLRNRRVAIDAARALGGYFGRERVSGMATRLGQEGAPPLVGINADFFDLKSGEVENNLVVRGEWVKGTLQTDSPHDAFDNAHTQFGIDARGRPMIGRFTLDGMAYAGSRRVPLAGLNYRVATLEGLVAYTPWYGARTPSDTSDRVGRPGPLDPDAVSSGSRRDSTPPRPATELRADSAHRAAARATRDAVEAILTRIGHRGDTVLYRATRGDATRGGGTAIPAQGIVLSGTGAAASAFVAEVAQAGSIVKVTHRIAGSAVAPRAVVGGWPRVVQAGRNLGGVADSLEGTFPRFGEGRHPRSALAITRDSTTLLMVVVDGRRPWSLGMSLEELGGALLALGAWDAMNLDGGGSSTLWIRGQVVNHPSDPAGERAVGNALFVGVRSP